jgi:hypothetical protein
MTNLASSRYCVSTFGFMCCSSSHSGVVFPQGCSGIRPPHTTKPTCHTAWCERSLSCQKIQILISHFLTGVVHFGQRVHPWHLRTCHSQPPSQLGLGDQHWQTCEGVGEKKIWQKKNLIKWSTHCSNYQNFLWISTCVHFLKTIPTDKLKNRVFYLPPFCQTSAAFGHSDRKKRAFYGSQWPHFVISLEGFLRLI